MMREMTEKRREIIAWLAELVRGHGHIGVGWRS